MFQTNKRCIFLLAQTYPEDYPLITGKLCVCMDSKSNQTNPWKEKEIHQQLIGTRALPLVEDVPET